MMGMWGMKTVYLSHIQRILRVLLDHSPYCRTPVPCWTCKSRLQRMAVETYSWPHSAGRYPAGPDSPNLRNLTRPAADYKVPVRCGPCRPEPHVRAVAGQSAHVGFAAPEPQETPESSQR
ncbi:hypothetical protein J6590_082477 [Homalodisca vitripennis]|nr:hypothetical protein J6590_082477 [Homalodisca vitripennis]